MNGLVASNNKSDTPISFPAFSCTLLFKKFPSTQSIKIIKKEYISASVCSAPNRTNGSVLLKNSNM